MDHAVLDALNELTDEHTAPKLALYLDGQDVPDPWKRPDEAFTACVSVIEAGAGHHSSPRSGTPARGRAAPTIRPGPPFALRYG